MNEPKRVLDSGSPRLRALVLAGKRDVPKRDTEAAVLGALGLGVAGGAALGAGGAVQAVAPSALAKFLAALRHVAFSKVGIGVIAATVTGSAGYLAGRVHERAIVDEQRAAKVAPTAAPLRPSPSVAPSIANTEAERPSARGAIPSVSSRIDSAPPVTPSAAAHEAPPRAGSEGHAANPVVAVDPSARLRSFSGGDDPGNAQAGVGHVPDAEPPSIVAQLESIRRARALVQEGDGKAALRELDMYDARSPHGTFEEECMALRVRALRLDGDTVGAARELANLQSRFPTSVHLAALAH